MNRIFCTLLFCPLLTLAAPVFSAPYAHAETAPATGPEETAYTAGTRAMNESRWADAVLSFDQVVNAGGKKADAALYWKAYSLNKLGKRDLASETCVQLKTHFKDSTWNGDCRALALSPRWVYGEQRGTVGIPPVITPGAFNTGRSSQDPDAEMKILALNSLLHRDPAQAVPLLRGIVTGDQSHEVKRQALFVLAQGHSPEAQALLHDLVMGKMGTELQKQSIQAVGVYQGRRSDDLLAEVYQATSDLQVKQAVISALFVANDDVRMVAMARSEKDLEMKRNIVSQLSLMQGKAASDYMLELLK